MKDADILKEFIEEYRTQSASEPHSGTNIAESLSSRQLPSQDYRSIVKRFYDKFGVDFLRLFFNKLEIAKVWEEIDSWYSEDTLIRLIGENLYLLEDMNDPVAGEITNVYLESISIVYDEEDNTTSAIYYVTPALKILLRYGMTEEVQNHIDRFFRDLYDFHDHYLRNARASVGEKAGEWVRMLIQIQGVKTVDRFFGLLLLRHVDDLNRVTNESRYAHSIFTALTSGGPEYVKRILEKTAKDGTPHGYEIICELLGVEGGKPE